MFGYITIAREDLKIREFDIYRGYYCGVCKSLGQRYGQISRAILSYDGAFLALLLESLEAGEEVIEEEHCLLHHIKKNPVVKNSKWTDYAADMLIMLSYHKLLDDKEDEHKVRGSLGTAGLKGAYLKASKRHERVAGVMEEQVEVLKALEEGESPSLDRCGETSGKILKAMLDIDDFGEHQRAVLKELGNSLGIWIYLMDALDDYSDDKKAGLYNPLIYRTAGLEGLEPVLYERLGRISSALDLLEIRKNKGIIDNIIMMGIRAQTDRVLQKIADYEE